MAERVTACCKSGHSAAEAHGLGLPNRIKVDPEETEARRILLETTLEMLYDGKQKSGAEMEHTYDDLIHGYKHRLTAMSTTRNDKHESEVDVALYWHLQRLTPEFFLAELLRVLHCCRLGTSTRRDCPCGNGRSHDSGN